MKIKPDFMRTKHERIESFKKLWREEYDQDLADAQALEYSENLLGLYRTLLDVHIRIERKERLTKEPDGFAVTGQVTYSCAVCSQHMFNDEGWYDQSVIKCPVCQKAVKEGVIPGEVACNADIRLSSDDLKKKFGWHHTTVAKKVRNGELKARQIKNGEHHRFFVFLKEENPGLLKS